MTDYLSLPPRLNELWPWFNAVSSWDWGDTQPLAELILTEPIPPEFQAAVSAMCLGPENAAVIGTNQKSLRPRG